MSNSIQIKGNYLQDLRNAQPTVQKVVIPPPKGSMSAPRVVEHDIPPINTDIQFSAVLPQFSMSKHPGLAAMDIRKIPEVFDWRHAYPTDDAEIRKKKTLIAKPGNQATCGSCWAISGAGIIGDNFVVAGVVDWIPNLSTTWSLMCYPQNQCKGGNPGILFKDVAKGGIVSNHCIDYSWCIENDLCNGEAMKHLDAMKQAEVVGKMNSLIPSPCGCYYGDDEHYVYYPDPNITTISLESSGVTKDNIAATVKKHIYTQGPAMGGFIVFDNFKSGAFTKSNGGVYLENATYSDDGTITDWNNPKKFAGSHAVAIMGWGMAKNILVGEDKREDVPYWYCRNSWKDTWGDGGYFKMAMYPYNKTSQFEDNVTVKDEQGGRHASGGIVFIRASKKPVKKTLPQLKAQFVDAKKIHDNAYYQSDPQVRPKVPLGFPDLPYKKIFLTLLVILLAAGLVWLFIRYMRGRKRGGSSSGGGRHGSYRMT